MCESKAHHYAIELNPQDFYRTSSAEAKLVTGYERGALQASWMQPLTGKVPLQPETAKLPRALQSRKRREPPRSQNRLSTTNTSGTKG